MEMGFKDTQSPVSRAAEPKNIMVQDRATGKLVEEKIPQYIWISLHIMYQSTSGRFAVSITKVASVLKHLSEKQGKRYDASDSRKEIPSFIQFHKLNVNDILEPIESFKNFNQFFYRKLKKGARLIAQPSNPKVAVSAADCRLNVFNTVDEATNFWIKGKNFSLLTLLQDTQLAHVFYEGSMVIHRLAPQDYHRFHSPVDGVLGKPVDIDGRYYTVNPVAIRANVDVYTENKRSRVLIQSPQFGNVLYIAIGATMVGSINWTISEGMNIHRGDEMGYFAFGGSTIICLFEKGRIAFDDDLLVNSEKPIETLVCMGNSVGVATTEVKI